MGNFTLILASVADPIRFVITLVVSLGSRKKWIILVATIVSAVSSETLLTSLQVTRQWGSGIWPGLIASAVQAVLCYWVIGKFRGSGKKPTVPS